MGRENELLASETEKERERERGWEVLMGKANGGREKGGRREGKYGKRNK